MMHFDLTGTKYVRPTTDSKMKRIRKLPYFRYKYKQKEEKRDLHMNSASSNGPVMITYFVG